MNSAATSAPVLVVGAGWSGLACALELALAGRPSLVLDAAPQAGGRGRTLAVDLGGREYPLDNGQHLLVGACSEILRLARAAGLDPAALVLRRPFEVRYADGWSIRAARLPAPLHLGWGLVRAAGWEPGERLALARWSARQALGRWSAPAGSTVAEALLPLPPGLVRRLWRPLCLSVMNAEPGQACARLFFNVLRDTLGGGERASHLLLARCPLSSLLPDAAAAALLRLGSQMRLRSPVLALESPAAGAWTVRLREESIASRTLVLALPPHNAAALLGGRDGPLEGIAARLRAIGTAPISTVYLRYAPRTRLPHPFLALADHAAHGRHGQWVFDRGASDSRLDGVFSVVVSGEGEHAHMDRSALCAAVSRQLSGELGLPAPIASEAIIEKRATLAPVPGLSRPGTRLAPGLFLAGDAADSPYPSTLEGSVRAGVAAARAILEERSG